MSVPLSDSNASRTPKVCMSSSDSSHRPFCKNLEIPWYQFPCLVRGSSMISTFTGWKACSIGTGLSGGHCALSMLYNDQVPVDMAVVRECQH